MKTQQAKTCGMQKKQSLTVKYTGLPQEARKISNSLNIPKGARKRTTNKTENWQKMGINKD